jgi:excisionase family DNA binding protein
MMLTVPQAAKILNCHPETIRRLVKAQKIRAMSLSSTGRSQLRIDEKDLQSFINAQSTG